MKAPLKELVEQLAVDHIPAPYETCPWSAYDTEKGITCSAEVRMNADADEIEAEIQMVYDAPLAGTPPVEQVFFLHAKPDNNGKWALDILRVKRETYENKFSDWEKKGCDFFSAVVSILMRNQIPDIDELIERFFKSTENYGTGSGGGSNRKPIIRPDQILDPSRGRGF